MLHHQSGRRIAVLGVQRRVVLDAPFLADAVHTQMETLGKSPGRAPVRHGAASNAEKGGDLLVATKGVDNVVDWHHAARYSRDVMIVNHHTRERYSRCGSAIIPRMNTNDRSLRTVDAISGRLKQTRLAMGLTQVAFAGGAGVAANTYNQWEKGKQRPDLDQAQALCDAYGLTLDWVYRGDASGLPYNLATLLLGRTG